MYATTANADEAALIWLDDDPGRFQAAWSYIPNDRPGVQRLITPDALRIQNTGEAATLPVRLQDDDVAFSVDVRARGTKAFWKSGGTAILVMKAASSGQRLLRVGLPKGAALYLDGRRLFGVDRDESVPEARSIPIEVEQGEHLIAITLPATKQRWHGAGFHLRWLTPALDPDPTLTFALFAPKRTTKTLLKHVFKGKMGMHLQADHPTWSATASLGPNIPKALSNTTATLTVRSALATSQPVSCTKLKPMQTCSSEFGWPMSDTVSNRRLAPAQLMVGVGSKTHVPVASWESKGVTQRDLQLRQTLVAALKEPAVTALPDSSQATMAHAVQELDDLLWGEGLLKPKIELKEVRARLQRYLKALERYTDPIATQRGLHRRAYKGPFDHRYQPYALLVPKNYAPGQRYPLIVALHGHTGTPMRMCNAVLGGATAAELERRYDPSFFLLCPFGYGETAFRYVGEDDLFRSLAAVEHDFSIDPDRVYLTGLSDGGLAAFEVGLHHPDRWAAVAPMGAVADMMAFPTIRKNQTPYEKAWVTRVSAVNRAMNGSGLDFLIAYGAKDRLDKRWVEGTVKALEHWGAKVTYRLHEDLGHNVWDRTYAKGDLFEWFAPKRRQHPSSVHYVSYTPRRRGAWGVVLDKYDAGATIHVEQRPVLSVKARGVRQARIALKNADTIVVEGKSYSVEPGAKGVRIVWNGAAVASVSALTRTPTAPSWPVDEGQRGRIAPGAGPLDEMRAGAQHYVYGTGDRENMALYRYLAELEQRRWSRGITLRTQLSADTDVHPKWRKTHHVVLVGKHEALADAFARFVPESAQLLAKHPGEAVGLRTIAAHPDHKGLTVVHLTGTTSRGVVWTAHLPEILPDRVWVTERSALPPFGMVLGDRQVRDYAVKP